MERRKKFLVVIGIAMLIVGGVIVGHACTMDCSSIYSGPEITRPFTALELSNMSTAEICAATREIEQQCIEIERRNRCMKRGENPPRYINEWLNAEKQSRLIIGCSMMIIGSIFLFGGLVFPMETQG